MDLTQPVLLKNNPMDFNEYMNTIEREQTSCLQWLNSGDVQWNTPESLRAKVNLDGSLMPFYGDTVVIPLHPGDLAKVQECQMELRKETEEIFAEPLLPEFFHITLHDLTADADKKPIKDKVKKNKAHCEKIFREVAAYLKQHKDLEQVAVHSTHSYPSVNVSVVLGFAPDTDRDYRTIMNLYNLFDDVVYLNYWLRMHVTLSYFRPLAFSQRQIANLANALNKLQREPISLKLDLWKMEYQRFTTMNNYETEFTLGDFR